MATSLRSPLFGAEPFEENQGTEAPASPDELRQFYFDMEKREQAQRQLSRRKSSGRSRWNRGKSLRKLSDGAHQPTQVQPPTATTVTMEKRVDKGKERQTDEQPMFQEEEQNVVARPPLPVSIVPDTGPYVDGNIPPLATTTFKSSYNIHNPFGPRWYKNQHLLPPTSRAPPSSFSPSFPPMGSTPASVRSEDVGRMPGPSRTPSGSPLPTPNSSQTRISDGNPGVRSRKISQTAHDDVDMLDASDPWGTNWHHTSPYDVGINSNQANTPPGGPEGQTRSRQGAQSYTTGQGRKKGSTPSPLSQSTSAIHLTPGPPAVSIPRKLSKRRKPGIRSLFGGATDSETKPTTPIDSSTVNVSPANESAPTRPMLSKRNSTLPSSISNSSSPTNPSSHTSTSAANVTDKKEKRGSMLGRLSKKLSVLRRPIVDRTTNNPRNSTDLDRVHLGDAQAGKLDDSSPGSEEVSSKIHSPGEFPIEPRRGDSNKRIPPPSLDLAAAVTSPTEKVEVDNRSSISLSLETPFSIGRLTIANPDATSSGPTTPTGFSMPPPGPFGPSPPQKNEQPRENKGTSGTKDTSDHPSEMQPQAHFTVPSVERQDSSASPPVPSKSPYVQPVEFPSMSQHPPESRPHPQPSRHSPTKPSSSRSVEPPASSRALPAVDSEWVTVDPKTLAQSSTYSEAELPSSAKGRSARVSSAMPIVLALTNSDRTTEYSPLSRASILANPPTPESHPGPIHASRSSQSEKVPIRDSSQGRDTSPEKSQNVSRSKVTEGAPDNTSWTRETRTGESSKGRNYSPEKSQSASRSKITEGAPDGGSRTREGAHTEETSKGRNTSPDKLQSVSQSQLLEDAPNSKLSMRGEIPIAESSKVRNPSPDKGQTTSRSKTAEGVPDGRTSSRKDKGKQSTTETFKLIRTASDGIRMTSESIPVGEEQWTVVHAPESTKKERSSREREKKAKDPEAPRRKDSRRHEIMENGIYSEHERSREHDRVRSTITRDADNGFGPVQMIRPSRSRSLDAPERSGTVPPTVPPKTIPLAPEFDYSPERRREGYDSFPTDRQSPPANYMYKPQPQPLQSLPAHRHATAERRPSLNKRPVSDIPSSTDVASLTAHEAWAADRMWKGKSAVFGKEVAGVVSSDPGPSHAESAYRADTSRASVNGSLGSVATHGSGHTAYMVQRPHHQSQNGYQNPFYSQLPVPPHHAVYSLPNISSQSSHSSPGPYDYPNTYRSFHDSASFPTIPSPESSPGRRPLSNPLPEPPRQSAYHPPPLSTNRSNHASGEDPSSADYWIKYAGITTAH